MGGITEIATSAPGLQLDPAEHRGAARRDAEAQRLLHGAVRQVPRGAGLGDEPDGAVRRLADRRRGFEHFYGFIGGETNQYAPAIYEGTVPVEPDRTPEEGYHFTEDMTDHAIDWVRQQKALMPDKPFFVYYAPGATHAPHHVPTEWSAKYKGQFDQGWDALREETFARQKELGVIPEDAELTARPAEIPAWDDMPDDLKPVLARQMEVYAGFLEHTDHHVGRLIDALDDLEVLDDTLVYYIIGDNGASAEGTPNGCFNELIVLTAPPGSRRPSSWRRGSTTSARPTAYNHYAVGWAHAMDTPYQWTKQVASHWGGTRNGTIVHWPTASRRRASCGRSSTTSSTSRPPCSTPPDCPSRVVNGVQQMPLEGCDGLHVRRRRGARAAHDAVLRDVLQPRHLPRGLDRGHPAQHAVGDGRDAGVRRRRVGALRAGRLDPGARPRRRAAREARRAAAPLPDRGGQVQRLPARRPPRRALQPRPRRPARSWSAAPRSCSSAAWGG